MRRQTPASIATVGAWTAPRTLRATVAGGILFINGAVLFNDASSTMPSWAAWKVAQVSGVSVLQTARIYGPSNIAPAQDMFVEIQPGGGVFLQSKESISMGNGVTTVSLDGLYVPIE